VLKEVPAIADDPLFRRMSDHVSAMVFVTVSRCYSSIGGELISYAGLKHALPH